MEPARLDPRNLGRGKGLGALRPGERAPRVAEPAESPASSPADESWRKPTWARGTSAEANAWEAAMRRPQ